MKRTSFAVLLVYCCVQSLINLCLLIYLTSTGVFVSVIVSASHSEGNLEISRQIIHVSVLARHHYLALLVFFFIAFLDRLLMIGRCNIDPLHTLKITVRYLGPIILGRCNLHFRF